MSNQFNTHVDGIECQCKVLHYRPTMPANTFAPLENQEEETPSEFTMELLDLCGNPAPTLHNILTDDDFNRLQDEYEAFITAEKYAVEF